MTKGGSLAASSLTVSSLREQDSHTLTLKGDASDEHSLSIDLLLPV